MKGDYKTDNTSPSTQVSGQIEPQLESTKYRITKNSIWNVLGWGGGLIVNFIAVPLLIRFLGSEQYGLMILLTCIISPLGLLDFGMSDATVKYLAESLAGGKNDEAERYVQSAFIFNLVIGFLGALIIMLSAKMLVLHVFNVPKELYSVAEFCLYWVGLLWFATQVRQTFIGAITAKKRYDILNSGLFISQVITVSIGIGVLLYGGTLLQFIQLQAIINVLTWGGWYFLAKRLLPQIKFFPHVHMKALRKTTRFGFWQMLNIFGGIFSAQSQRLLLGMMLTVISVGFYNIAAQIVNMVYMLALKIGQVLFPEISSLQGKGEEEKAAYLVVKTNWFVTIIVMSIYVALVVLIPDFLILWVGQDVAKETISVARILVIGVSIGSVFAIPSNFLLGTARGKWLAVMAFAQGILVLISSALLIPQFGLSGAGWSITIGALTHIVVLFLMWKIIFIKWLPGKIYFTPLIAPMGMAYIVAFILLYIKSDSIWATTWLKCGFLGISCVIVSALIFFLFDAVFPGGKQRRSFLYSLIGRIRVTHSTFIGT